MRVVMVNRYATAGAGAEKHVVGLCAALRERGHEVHLLSTVDESNAERQGAFVPLAGTDFWRGTPPLGQSVRVAGRALWNRSAAGAMRALLDRFRPDIVHAHDLYPQLSPAPVAVAAARAVPVVQTIHNYEPISASATDHHGGWLDRSAASPPVRLLRTLLYLSRRRLHVPRVDAWVAVSRYVAAVVGRHGIRAEAIPNFVAAAKQPPAAFDEREGVVFVGRLTEEKGAADVVELARLLPDRRVCVAGRGPLAELLATAAGELPNLAYSGQLPEEEVREELARARVAVVPSRWQEPAGLVALEAMAEGTPVVAYDSGGLAEYVRDAGAGRVVPPSPPELASAVAALDRGREEWEEASRRGREAVAGEHSPGTYVARLESVYQRVAATAEAPGSRAR